MKMKTQQPMGHFKSNAKWKGQSTTGLPEETEKSQINNLTLQLKQLEKENWRTPEVVEGKKS